MAAALLARALIEYFTESEDLHDMLGQIGTDSHAVHHAVNLDLHYAPAGELSLFDQLTKAADAYSKNATGP